MWVIVIENTEGNNLSENKLKLIINKNRSFNVTKFANYNDLMEVLKYKCRVKITHWNAMTGKY